MNFKCKIYATNTTITNDNVKELSEYITLNCIKSCMRFSQADFYLKLYDNLIIDLHKQKDLHHSFSYSYDLVMEAYCFLYANIGKTLSDITTITKYGTLKPMTVLNGCAFIVMQQIRKDFFAYNCYDIEPLYKYNLYRETEECDEEWLKVDEIIKKLDLNENELKTLDCLLSGKSLSETARIISCGLTTVFDRRNKLQKKYLSLVR